MHTGIHENEDAYKDISGWTYRAWDNKVGLWVEVTAEHIVAVSFQGFHTFALWHETFISSTFTYLYSKFVLIIQMLYI